MKTPQFVFKMLRYGLLFCVLLCAEISGEIKVPPIIDKLFNRPQDSVSQFPPIVEFLVQKIQSQYSNYVHEDLSRPPTWDKPVFTLTPEDQAIFSSASTPNSTFLNEDRFEYVDTENTTEIFFEIIVDNNKDKPGSLTQNIGSNDLDKTTQRVFEKISTSINPNNETVVYITPKKPYSTTPKYEKRRKDELQ